MRREPSTRASSEIRHRSLDEWLKDERRDRNRQRRRIHVDLDLEPIRQAQLFEGKIVLGEAPLLREEHLVFGPERIPQQVPETFQRFVGAHRIARDERTDRVQRVEQKVRVDLSAQRDQLRLLREQPRLGGGGFLGADSTMGADGV
jgi:hypothetical protein